MHTTLRLIPTLVLALVLVACGQPDSSPSPTATDAASTAAASASAPAAASASAPASVPLSPSGSPDATAGADADAPEGWTRITVADDGFSIAFPDTWEELSAETIADSGIMDELSESNPDAATALDQAEIAIQSGQIALFAFDASGETATETGFATNLNIIPVGPVQETAEEAVEEVADSIQASIPVTGEVRTETTSLPAGDAGVISYEWEIADAEGATTPVSVVQYAVITDSGMGFILSLSAATEVVDQYSEIFEQIAETLREEPA